MTAQNAFARFCYSDLRPISDVDIQLTIVGFGTTIVPLRSVDLPPRDPRHRLVTLIKEVLSVHVYVSNQREKPNQSGPLLIFYTIN